jgi:hypothetical protein
LIAALTLATTVAGVPAGASSAPGLVTDDAGRSINFGYDGNNLATFTDPLLQTTTFAYDGAASRLT